MKKYSKEAQGILWTLSGAVSYPLLTAIVRHLTDLGMASPQIVFVRNLTALALLVPFVFIRREKMDVRIRNPRLYFIRIVFGLTAMMLWFYGLGRLPLATATALSFSTPIFSALAAIVFLKEKMGIRRWSAVGIGVIGILIILRPGELHFGLPAVAILAGCFFTSFTLIIVKKLTNTETPFNMMFHMHLWMALFSIPLAFYNWQPFDSNMLLWCVGLAVFSIIGQYGLARAYALVDVTVTLPFDFIKLIVASAVAYPAFGEVPDLWTYVGAGVIICSSVFIVHREARLRRAKVAEAVGLPD